MTGVSEIVATPAPSTPLGPFKDNAVDWTTWVTLMGFVGLVAFALSVAGPVARRCGGPAAVGQATTRVARVAAPLGLLAVVAVLSDLAHQSSLSGGFDYAAGWKLLYDGSSFGRLLGLEVTLSLAGAVLVAPLAARRVADGPARVWLLGAGLLAGAVALGTTKFPAAVPEDWDRTVVETVMWMLHLFGGAVWVGGLAGLVLLALPGGVVTGDRGAFWSAAIRRFSAVATSCVAAIALSGLFLYWEHVDGPAQLLHTMYGRVLGVKILLFGTLLLLGMVNQFWLHPRLDALRAAGDTRPLRTIITREFPAVVTVELVLALGVLFAAPFLHGSARDQAFQADAARQASSTAAAASATLGQKQVSASTWVWGVAETVVVLAVLIGGYLVSGRLAARSRAVPAEGTLAPRHRASSASTASSQACHR